MNKTILFFTILISSYFFVSCTSGLRKEIDATDNPTIKILKIREIAFQKRYALAIALYKQVQQEFPEDKALQVEIDYEIAFLYVKQKKYKKAKPKLEAIITKYETEETTEQPSKLPQWPYYLSKKILTDVVEKKLNENLTLWNRLFPE